MAFDPGLAESDGLTPTVMERNGNDVIAEFEIDPAVLHDCAGAPPAPTDLHVVSNRARTVVLEWSPVVGTRTSYVVELGRDPRLRDALSLPVGGTTTYTASPLNPATYYVRVKAKNLCGVSSPWPGPTLC